MASSGYEWKRVGRVTEIGGAGRIYVETLEDVTLGRTGRVGADEGRCSWIAAR